VVKYLNAIKIVRGSRMHEIKNKINKPAFLAMITLVLFILGFLFGMINGLHNVNGGAPVFRA